VSDVRIRPEGTEDQASSFEVERQAFDRLLEAEIVEQVRELAGSFPFAGDEDEDAEIHEEHFQVALLEDRASALEGNCGGIRRSDEPRLKVGSPRPRMR
jgi:hypothetical protein